MNIHIPQSIQTVTELLLIANVIKRFVSPATSEIVINAKQDSVMGSYPMTYDTTYIDWKDAMNILMNTSVGLKGDIPKHKKLQGKFVYSEIIPDKINAAKRKEDGGYQMRIKNGEILDGTFGKSDIRTILKKIWLEYGSNETKDFIDDIQRMILQFLMRYGFTMGISYIVVPKEIHKSIKQIIETERKETLTAITEYENDSYVMTTEAFEESLTKGLQAIQENINKLIINSFSNTNGIFIAISSGSSGLPMNTGQIIGCIGQVVVEQKRIQKRFNGRSLPMFNKYDDGPFARGFCHNSFISGLSPPEFFFQIMAGREGVINTAIKTADTGYLQRKLIKVLEDIKVEYDGTVRNTNDKIIQCVYGDNGVNTEKQVDQKIGLIAANNDTIREKYIYSKNELNELKNTKYTADLNEALYNKLILMRDHMRYIQKKTNIEAVSFKESYMVPVDINQYITNIMNRVDRSNDSTVDPYYVLGKIREMYISNYSRVMKYNEKTSTIKKEDDKRIKLLLKFYLFDVLIPKKCTVVYKLSTKEFDEIVDHFKTTIKLAYVEGGEMVGFVGAHSIGEPVTQSNLKSFHKSGTGKTVVLGLPRTKELLSITRNIKTPVTTIILENKYKTDKTIAKKIASYLKYTTFKDVIDAIGIYYDPDPFGKTSIMTKDDVTNIFEGGQGRSGCQTEIHNLPWIIRLVLSKEKLLERNITMLDIKTSFCKNWASRFEEKKGIVKEYKKIIDKITQTAIITNYDNSKIPIVHIRFDANNYNFNTLIQFQDMIINKYKIKGIPGITESNNIREETYVTFDKDGNKVDKKQWIINTEGINLTEISQLNGINLTETFCNDISTIYQTYGVEAARTAFIKEFTAALESSGGYSNYQHIEILADAITHMGTLIPVNRHGANKLDTDPFSRASFEKTVEQMLGAAVFGEADHIRSVSARIMVGALINGGTGSFDLLLDHIKVKKTLMAEPVVAEKIMLKKKTAVSDLIRKKKKEK